jgi:two-component system NtrC family sensor kinase
LKFANINVEKRLEEGLPDIQVDRKQFQEVLFNLIRNAAQAINKKGKITIAGRTNDGRVAIDIQDTGSGIPQDKVNKLFGAFFTTKEPGKGTGLGLYIVRKIVEKNNGTIYLKETRVGEGTTFSLEFPAA